MFCPSCGAEATPGLKYCKRCGGNLGDAVHIAAQASDSSSSKYTGAALIIGLTSVAISLGGIGIVFSQAMELVGPHFPGPRVGDATMVAMTMIIFGSATVFGIMALLIRLFTRLLTAPSEPARPPVASMPVTGSYTPSQIQAPPVPLSSVTEHTTRTFGLSAYDEAGGRE